MSLANDLLEQAENLARQEARRPRQASLRRSVSSAYYALFHLLIQDAAGQLMGRTVADTELRNLTARAFQHGDMERVCKRFRVGYGGLPKHLQPLFPGQNIPLDIMLVADVFVDLQAIRHEADYDPGRQFRRTEVLTLLRNVEDAFAAWERVRRTAEAKAFLAALLLDTRWGR